MGRGEVIPFDNFSGGEASSFPHSAMPYKYSTLIQNGYINIRGGVAKLPGYAAVNAAAEEESLYSGFDFKKLDGTVIRLAAGGGKIFKVTGDSLTAIKTGLDSQAKVSFASQGNICIMVNGVDAHMKYDGTTVSALGGSPPATAFLAFAYKGRVWMLERNNKMLATHSALNAPEDYTTPGNAGYLDFKYVLKKGDELLDITTFAGMQVFIFRDHVAVYSGSNPTSGGDYALQQILPQTGILGTGAQFQVGTDLLLATNSGIVPLSQVALSTLKAGQLSQLIDSELSEKIDLHSTSNKIGFAHYAKLKILMFLLGDTIWIYSYNKKAWSRMVGVDANGLFMTGDGKKVFICGTGHLYEFGVGWTFNGVFPEFKWKTAWLNLTKTGNSIYPKTLKMIAFPQDNITLNMKTRYDLNAIEAANQTIDMASAIDLDIDAVTDWDAITQIDSVPFSRCYVPLFGSGSMMQLEFSNTSDKRVEINSFNILYEEGGF